MFLCCHNNIVNLESEVNLDLASNCDSLVPADTL